MTRRSKQQAAQRARERDKATAKKFGVDRDDYDDVGGSWKSGGGRGGVRAESGSSGGGGPARVHPYAHAPSQTRERRNKEASELAAAAVAGWDDDAKVGIRGTHSDSFE